MMEDFKEQKTAFGYVMESRIINKCGFFAFGYGMVGSNESCKVFGKGVDR